MKSNIIHVGLDVDDTQYHGLPPRQRRSSGSSMSAHVQGPADTALEAVEAFSRLLDQSLLRGVQCGLQPAAGLTEHGYHCDVVAPTQIPKPRGKAVKTDRIDAKQLAQYYANDLLTIFDTPEAELEADRDLLRSRQNLMDQRTKLHGHIQSLLRRHGWHCKAQTQNKTHWTQRHHQWLERTVEGLSGA